MPIDRETTLRQAERLQRQGRLDLAIAEYVRLIEEQPRDWNAINALGDLYLQAGDVDRGVAQFVTIADHLFSEGFFPKAAALYKKALKARSDHEHTLLRLADIAAVQELLADARAYLRRLWELRSDRGDERAAAECLIRLALLPEADAETLLAGARASKALEENDRAVTLFRAAAEQLQKAGRVAAALDALSQVLALDPSDIETRRQLVHRYVVAGQVDQAAALLDRETAGSDPDLLLALAQIQITSKDDAAIRSTLTRFVGVAPERWSDVLRLAADVGRSGDPQRAFACTEVVVDDAVLRAEWDRAIDVVQSFLGHGPHVPALEKLVQIAGEAGPDEVLHEARERLADAYLENGQGVEARTVAEVLLARAVDSPVHAARLRRALELLEDSDPDATVRGFRDRLVGPTLSEPAEVDVIIAVDREEPIAESDAHEFEDVPVTAGSGVAADVRRVGDADVKRVVDADTPAEIDLSEAISALGGATQSAAPIVGQAAGTAAVEVDLESVLDAMRPRAADYRSVGEAAELYERGRQRLEAGQAREGLADLEEAARVPAFRFQAASRLAREYLSRGHSHAAIEWLERAADVPPPTREDGLAVLYDLAIALDQIGESTRALALLMELDADEPSYRDVPQRLEVLARADDKRRG